MAWNNNIIFTMHIAKMENDISTQSLFEVLFAHNLVIQLNHLASLAKWLKVCLKTKWL